MKKQIEFFESDTSYQFYLPENKDNAFEISKETLVFDTNRFFCCFFSSLEEKPQYEVSSSQTELDAKALYIIKTVSAILEKSCNSIDEKWFNDTSSAEGSPSIENEDEQIDS